MTSPHGRVSGLLVAVGGFAGALARYAVDLTLGASLQSTHLVNVVGSFALAVLLARVLAHRRTEASTADRRFRRFAGTGFLSSFTTYSTFVVDAIQQTPAVATGYVLVTYACGFAAAAIGMAASDWWGDSR